MVEFAKSKIDRKYGAVPSRIDHRDYGFPSRVAVMVDAPMRASITPGLGPVKNQANEGSCTAHGGTSMEERLYRAVVGKEPVFSPAFTYALERQQEGSPLTEDSGAQVVTSLIVPNKFGSCPLDVMPYTPGDFSTAPTDTQLAAAKAFPGGAYHSLGLSVANMRSCILSPVRKNPDGTRINGYTFVIGIAVYESFEADADTPSIPYPDVNAEQLLGYHEMHAGIEYDDTIECPNSPNKGAILVMNSWGTSWGIVPPTGASSERGFKWISYDYLTNPALTTDVRFGHLGRAW